jgi:glycine/D-amino acid oxidase-like deaminating enzyme
MEKNAKIVIIGAGIFGLSTAYQLASEGHQNIVVLDRHMPPVSQLFNPLILPG